MGGIFNFFGEEITGVDDSRDVSNFDCFVLMLFTHTTLVKVDVFGAFEGDR